MVDSATKRRGDAPPLPTVTGLPEAPRRRRPLLVAGGLLVALVTAAIVAFAFNTVTATTLVWTTATEVQRGTPVVQDQLVAVEVPAEAADRLLAASIESRDGLVGQVWAADLPADEYVTAAVVARRVSIEAGTGLVGLRLDPGALPVTGLQSGDQVMVVLAPSQGGGEVRVLVEEATVESVVVLSDQGPASPRLVTVAVPAGLASAVAAAGVAGEAALVVVP